MPEGRWRRCPNVINIFRARRVEKDSLPPPFLHPPRLVLFSPGPPIFLLMHPPLRVRRRFSICISLSPSCIYSRRLIPLHQPSLSFSPSPPFRKGTQLNSQRPHREESVNATGKRERENVELLRAYVSRLLKSFSSCRNSNFVAFTWANLRAEARQAKRDVGIIHFGRWR